MSPDRWQQIKQVAGAAMELAEERRAAYLDQECGSDQELRQAVEAILAEDGKAGGTIEGVIAAAAAEMQEQAPRRSGDMLGRTISHYKITEKLGEGGMGVVYKAEDLKLGRAVALKFLPAHLLESTEHKARFLHEARASAQLDHPNICTVHEIDEANGRTFLAMACLEGQTLKQKIAERPLPLNEALDIAMQIGQGLHAAHEKRIVHRDIKPANIMVTPQGHVKIMDFGLAQLSDSTKLTETGTRLGTPAYMSPEQVEGKPTDRRTDIWSLGVVLYEMVGGQVPFAGQAEAAVAHAILHTEPEPLTAVRSKVPIELDRVMEKALGKSAAERYQHVDEMMVDLRVVRKNLKSGQSPATAASRSEAESGAEHAVPGPARPSARATLILAVFVSLAVGTAVTYWLTSSAPPGSDSRPQLQLTRLTSDSGLTYQPALSPDGKLLAYASDRAGEGNLDIWLQQVAGGEPIRLTNDPSDDSQPTFSPDGTKIAFRSERDGSGIYVISAFGGNARLIANNGRDPRFSPDGSRIAYWTGVFFNPGANLGEIYIVSANGGEPRRLQEPGISAAFDPIWSPDGKSVLFMGSPGLNPFEEPPDWWVVASDAEGAFQGAPARTGARDHLRQWGLSATSPTAWLPEGNQIVFSASTGHTTNLWQVSISPRGWQVTGTPRQLTFGTGVESQASVAAVPDSAGTVSRSRLVFSILNDNVDIWALPLKVDSQEPIGQLRRLTQDASADSYPEISPDGKKLLFTSDRSGSNDIWSKDLESSAEVRLTTTPRNELRPALAADGTRVAYHVLRQGGSSCEVIARRTDAAGVPQAAVPRALPDNCWRPWSWSSDGTKLLYLVIDKPDRVEMLNVISGETKTLLRDPEYGLYQAYFSPDDRWISFGGANRHRVFVTRFLAEMSSAETDWIAIADGGSLNNKPRWSRDGARIYFFSNRDGFLCIWAQNVDQATKRPLGSPFAVYHSHSARLSLVNVGIDPMELSVASDKLVFPMAERTGNIWMAKTPE